MCRSAPKSASGRTESVGELAGSFELTSAAGVAVELFEREAVGQAAQHAGRVAMAQLLLDA